jgi:enterochelin esterase-like enzyme
MHTGKANGILEEAKTIRSRFLEREMRLDFFLPRNISESSDLSLLLINDGQNMQELGLREILHELIITEAISPVLCVAIHAGIERKHEYGIASQNDYLGRGSKAGSYTDFIVRELMPFVRDTFPLNDFRNTAFAGFSLGALMALDIVLNHPGMFSKAGLFSGSFWWRSLDQEDPAYRDDEHRIMQQVIRKAVYQPGLQFFFQCGNMDETCDRNNNGIIDSIDDTLDMISELKRKGYQADNDIAYLEMPDGKHDIATWSRAMPIFLRWAFGKETPLKA